MDINSINHKLVNSNSNDANKHEKTKEIKVEIERAKEAGKQFEAHYLGFMLEQVFSKLPTDGLVSGGHTEKIYRSMLVQEYAKQITNNPASNTSLGLADAVTKELLQSQFSNTNSVLIDKVLNDQNTFHNNLTKLDPHFSQDL